MKRGQWTKVLTENGLAGAVLDGQLVPCRAEVASPSSGWDNIWRLCRLNGLDIELASLNFKLLHGLLITRKGLVRLNPSLDTNCTLCTDHTEDSLVHSFIECSFNNGMGQSLLQMAKSFVTDITPEAMLRLEFSDLPNDTELPFMIICSTVLHCIWEGRKIETRILPFVIRCQLEAKCQLLREIRFQNEANIFNELIQLLR